jgi:hypothetical protein
MNERAIVALVALVAATYVGWRLGGDVGAIVGFIVYTLLLLGWAAGVAAGEYDDHARRER